MVTCWKNKIKKLCYKLTIIPSYALYSLSSLWITNITTFLPLLYRNPHHRQIEQATAPPGSNTLEWWHFARMCLLMLGFRITYHCFQYKRSILLMNQDTSLFFYLRKITYLHHQIQPTTIETRQSKASKRKLQQQIAIKFKRDPSGIFLHGILP